MLQQNGSKVEYGSDGKPAAASAKKDREIHTLGLRGFGVVGSYAASAMLERGVRVVAVSDSSGAIYRHDGLEIPALIAFKLETGSVLNFPGSKKIDQDSVFTLPVDILVPSAREGAIHAGNAARIEARIIAEGANHPVTREADVILRQEGRTVIPDVLANAGGVTVSYYEWVQDFNNFYWSMIEINTNLEKHIERALNDVYAIALEKKIDLRTAAYVLAITRINESTNLRGLYP